MSKDCSQASSTQQHQPTRAIRLAVMVTLGFMVVEFAGGWLANSLALMTDAAHMLTDSGALLLSLFAIWLSQRPRNQKLTFGYHRAEILGALTSGLLIWALAGVLIFEALQRVHQPPEVLGTPVMIIALIGLMVNLVVMRTLHGHHHHNLSIRAAYLHVLGDLLGSVGALASGVLIWWKAWYWVDPVLTIAFALLVLASSWKMVREAVSILMEGTPSSIQTDEVQKRLESLPNVSRVHDLHIWSLSSGVISLTVHLVSNQHAKTLQLAQNLLSEEFGILHSTIQIEENLDSACHHCD